MGRDRGPERLSNVTQIAPRASGWIWLPNLDELTPLSLSPRITVFWPCRSPRPWRLLPGMEHRLGSLLHHLRPGRGHPSVQSEPLLPPGDPAPPVRTGALPTRQGPQPKEKSLLEPG